ncbi:MAG: DUF4767 domain-containing protein [Lactobacillus sp.]|jgi:hypothetical protein|uniref:DUF4767 domain-containing protein n=1 Tax=Lacticaseibacillus suilingensis TaxID=2799577 RepID=A0ABW4BHR6_9LACO|nr:DUF4767 domain-containing protein [Lacticaseibacillus suilingensis]MCI1894650.1 DUF4767 domain-containing protein [Lactobacillus sp.]MCI1917575.1 DUF4767 domain-containing protein [Lactobacillus sp.]MCI1942304.1 DUF4767 domain-containing protein [Lactobacillus sp.]MCI1972756.1 DUF4767 domain-containing protein [Lactobacillus sp.]MCI2016545.1 DUF4767 domain-containing protein [Lactobacillus sp.]
MKNTKHLLSKLVALGATLALVGLAGCGTPAKSSHSTTKSSKVTKAKKKQTTTKKTAASSSQKQALWNTTKEQQLRDFIAQWAPTMGQSYTEYDGKTPLKTSVGTTYPDALKGIKIEQTTPGTIGWAPTGEGKYDYNVVAIYNYDGSVPPLPNHITYVFAFHEGSPIALVDQTRDGWPILTPTRNTEVKNSFAQIANASASDNAGTSDSTETSDNTGTSDNSGSSDTTASDSTSTSAETQAAIKNRPMSPQAIGVMIMMLRGDDVANDPNVTFDNNTPSYPYLVSSGTAVTQIPFHYNQTTITYAIRNPNYNDSDQVFEDHTISTSDLRRNFYRTPAQQQAVEAVVARLKH